MKFFAVCTFWGLLTVYMVSSFSAVLTCWRSGTLYDAQIFGNCGISVVLEYKFQLLLLSIFFFSVGGFGVLKFRT